MTQPSRPPSIYIIAGEESGDALGAALARALKQQTDGAVQLTGIGGRAMTAILALQHIGPTAIAAMRAALHEHELSFRD